MKYAVRESSRAVVYLEVSEDNRLEFECRSKCVLAMDKAIIDFRNSVLAMSKQDNITDSVSSKIDFIKSFISSYQETNGMIDKYDTELREINKFLSERNFIISRFYVPNRLSVIDQCMHSNVVRYGLTAMSFIQTDLLLLARGALLIPDIWQNDDMLLRKHKFEWFKEF